MDETNPVATSSAQTSPSLSPLPTPTVAPAAVPPLDSHILDELQNISLTQTRHPSGVAVAAAAPSVAQKQKHSPRRRKQQTQEVEEDEEEQGESAAVAPDDTAAQASQADLPPGVMLRIPLPTGLHINKKQRTKPTADGSVPTTTTQQALKPRNDASESSPQQLLNRASSNASVASAASSPSAPGSVTAGSIRCEPCNKVLSSSAQLADHELGRKHINTVLMLAHGGSLRCEICDKVFTSSLDQSKHLESSGHKMNVAQLQAPGHQMMSPISGAASVASGASSPYTVGAGSSQPYLLQASPTASSVSSPASSSHSRPLFSSQFTSPSAAASMHFCPLCRLRFPDAGALAHHFAGPRHAATVFEAQQQANRLAQERLQQQQSALQQSIQQNMATASMASAFQAQSMSSWPQQPMWQQPSPFQPSIASMQQFTAMNVFPPQMLQQPQQQSFGRHQQPPFSFSPIPLGSSQMSIHEEPHGVGVEEDQGREMEEDSIAAGMAAERSDELVPIEQNTASSQQQQQQPTGEGDVAPADPVIETEVQPSASMVQEEAKESAGEANNSAPADATPMEDSNTSRKRKYGRYSPAINNPFVRPRLQDPPSNDSNSQPMMQQQDLFAQAQQQLQQFPSFSSFMPPNGMPMCTCALTMLHGFPAQPCVFHSQQPSPWQQQHAQHSHGPTSVMPHPECRAPHYIYVAVHVPAPMLQATPQVAQASSMFPPQGMPSWGSNNAAAMQMLAESPDSYPMVTTTPPPVSLSHAHSHGHSSHRSPSQAPFNPQSIYHISLSPQQQQQQALARPTQRRRASGSQPIPSSRRATPTTPTQPPQ